jgi:hypothetical protein
VNVRSAGSAALLAVALLLVGCAPARSGSVGPAPTAAPQSTSAAPSSTAPSTSAPPSEDGGSLGTRTMTIQLWFTRDGKIVPTRRTRPATLATSRLSLTELIAGPTTVESAAGVGNGLAPNTTFNVIGVSGGVATVDFPPTFYSGGSDAARLRQAQVVYTLTQFPTVSKVAFQSAGAPTAAPVGRADYADLLPAIVVTSPAIGDRVASPVNVAGTANVFEATVSLRLLDAAGREIATTFTNASCGSGCRGDYSAAVSYQLSADQPGTIEVYEVSQANGSRVHVVRIPVVFARAG